MVIVGFFTCHKSPTWDRRLYFPSEERQAEDFFAPKNQTASAELEPANLGTRGQHVNHWSHLEHSLLFKVLCQHGITIYVCITPVIFKSHERILMRSFQPCTVLKNLTQYVFLYWNGNYSYFMSGEEIVFMLLLNMLNNLRNISLILTSSYPNWKSLNIPGHEPLSTAGWCRVPGVDSGFHLAARRSAGPLKAPTATRSWPPTDLPLFYYILQMF
jgi:hypothetical protein